jgi:hypothetical protein
MSSGGSNTKWTPVDQPALTAISNVTSTPGVVYPAATTALPAQLQTIPGVVSYFVSGYTSTVPLSASLTAGAELAVLRTDGNLLKGYRWVVASSANGQVMMNGPHYHSTAHHFPSTAAVPVEQLFGHASRQTKGKP